MLSQILYDVVTHECPASIVADYLTDLDNKEAVPFIKKFLGESHEISVTDCLEVVKKFGNRVERKRMNKETRLWFRKSLTKNKQNYLKKCSAIRRPPDQHPDAWRNNLRRILGRVATCQVVPNKEARARA